MEKNLEIYFDGQDKNTKLIHAIGLLWGQISSKLDEVLAPAKLNISKFNILMIIKHVGGYDGIQQNEISKRLLVTASNITKLLDKLEKDGLITRNTKKGDRRVKLIRITDYGSKTLDKIWPKYLKITKKINSHIASVDADYVELVLVDWLTNTK
ncbi:TPA: MarR family transcriptional regulator [Candidatus Scatenecus faecavium]|uniref:MarR family transcriptional regulator n=1 Tax=Candidatus Scatenecus faecavium TaxID=2840915 RepID=A0A9D1K3T9_9BACT|nr:MarR family transcriptional regulator [Candidatus Scatenecus faecavium]